MGSVGWEEIYISSQEEESFSEGFATGSFSITEIRDYFVDKAGNPSSESSGQFLSFFPGEKNPTLNLTDFLYTDLLGNIRLRLGKNVKYSFLEPILQNHSFTEILERTLTDQMSRPELHTDYLDAVFLTLLYQNRLKEISEFIMSLSSKNLLNLNLQIFSILSGLMKKPLENLVMSGAEKEPLNILYKYKFLEISLLERNRLYDLVLEKSAPSLNGIVFHLFSRNTTGIRNIFPIYKIIMENFDSLDELERKEFMESFQENGRFLQVYNFMKKSYSKKELRAWLDRIRRLNGKSDPDTEHSFKGYSEKEDLIQKYKTLRSEHMVYTLSPFEILLLLSSSVALQVKNEILEAYKSIPSSYIVNRSLSAVYYFQSDYRRFLLHLERSGSLQNHAESIYLKSLACIELGHSEEAKRLLLVLKSKFPDAEVIQDGLKKLARKTAAAV